MIKDFKNLYKTESLILIRRRCTQNSMEVRQAQMTYQMLKKVTYIDWGDIWSVGKGHN